MSNITTCLWFDTQAEEAANFYVKTFKDGGRTASIGDMARYGKSSAEMSGCAEGSVMTVLFELDGTSFMGLNGGPMFKFSMATSFIIACKTQEEIDHFWNAFGQGGVESQCGWINDKFGVSWQVVPADMGEIMGGPNGEKAMKAMLGMKKLDIAMLKNAAGIK